MNQMNQNKQIVFNNEKLQEEADHFYLCDVKIKEDLRKLQEDI